MAALLEACGLEKTFRTGVVERPVLRGLSLEVEQGEWVAAMGPSGCGKSTMLYLLGGLDLPDAGSIRLGDDELTDFSAPERARLRRRRVGFVFQQYNLIPHLDVAGNVELPQRLAGVSRHDGGRKVGRVARGARPCWPRAEPSGHAFGGEQQRVAIARAMANQPDLLLADEPTGALDSASSALVLDVLRAQHDRGQTIVMVTHDVDVAAVSDRIVHIRDGQIVNSESSGTVGST